METGLARAGATLGKKFLLGRLEDKSEDEVEHESEDRFVEKLVVVEVAMVSEAVEAVAMVEVVEAAAMAEAAAMVEGVVIEAVDATIVESGVGAGAGVGVAVGVGVGERAPVKSVMGDGLIEDGTPCELGSFGSDGMSVSTDTISAVRSPGSGT